MTSQQTTMLIQESSSIDAYAVFSTLRNIYYFVLTHVTLILRSYNSSTYTATLCGSSLRLKSTAHSASSNVAMILQPPSTVFKMYLPQLAYLLMNSWAHPTAVQV